MSKIYIFISFLILSGCIEQRVRPEDAERERRAYFDVASEEYRDRLEGEMRRSQEARKKSEVEILTDKSRRTQKSSVGIGDIILTSNKPVEKIYKFNIKLQCKLTNTPYMTLPLKNKTLFWEVPSFKDGQITTDMNGETGFAISSKEVLDEVVIEYAANKYRFKINQAMIITVQGCEDKKPVDNPVLNDKSLDLFSGIMSPPKKERLYQFKVRLQCEFLQNEHVGMKDKKFEWDLVGIKKGESYTDADGKATITVKTSEVPTYLDIYYQGKKHHYGASPVVIVNIQDCEI